MVHHTHANTRDVVKQLVLSKAGSRLLTLGLRLVYIAAQLLVRLGLERIGWLATTRF